MDRVPIDGAMEVNTQGNGWIALLRVKARMSGLMEESLKEAGNKINCMVEVFTLGLMEGNMMGSMQKIKRVDLEHITGQMEGYTKDTGWMVNNMVKEN